VNLATRGVTLALSGRRLLHGIDLTLRPGEVTAVLGPNGAGKTSLLRLLCGELVADTGEVMLGERLLGAWKAQERAKMLAVLPQQSVLNFPFTAREVVMLGRIPHGTGALRDREIVTQALRAVDGQELADREYTRLSGGEKQRVNLARVLAQVWEPSPDGARFLLLDEPTASFDLAHQRMTLEIVRGLAAQGAGVFLILHDLNLAARCADQVVLLHAGELVAAGSPQEVLSAELVRRVFAVDVSIGRHPGSGTPLVIA
tara:strand:+ start:820 stop:1593 length:774 start_codon:yes stop_codon:yes gene_type:complete